MPSSIFLLLPLLPAPLAACPCCCLPLLLPAPLLLSTTWLHQVWEAVSPRLQDKPDALAWLQRNTAPLKQQLAAYAAAAGTAAQPAAMAAA
jgi:hypothetical protein